jgi:hypothetical protein
MGDTASRQHRGSQYFCRTLCAVLLITRCAVAQDSLDGAGVRWPADEVDPLASELVLELRVAISPAVQVGESDNGHRQFIPITGGYFVGDGIRGTVLPGGADWQLQRPDGVREIVAIYAIQTDDGETIMVDNRGIAVPPDNPDGAPYVRTAPKFHAPAGKYDWLNEGIFVGSITGVPDGGAVIIRVFKVL